jgi:hypothetical protein
VRLNGNWLKEAVKYEIESPFLKDSFIVINDSNDFIVEESGKYGYFCFNFQLFEVKRLELGE